MILDKNGNQQYNWKNNYYYNNIQLENLGCVIGKLDDPSNDMNTNSNLYVMVQPSSRLPFLEIADLSNVLADNVKLLTNHFKDFYFESSCTYYCRYNSNIMPTISYNAGKKTLVDYKYDNINYFFPSCSLPEWTEYPTEYLYLHEDIKDLPFGDEIDFMSSHLSPAPPDNWFALWPYVEKNYLDYIYYIGFDYTKHYVGREVTTGNHYTCSTPTFNYDMDRLTKIINTIPVWRLVDLRNAEFIINRKYKVKFLYITSGLAKPIGTSTVTTILPDVPTITKIKFKTIANLNVSADASTVVGPAGISDFNEKYYPVAFYRSVPHYDGNGLLYYYLDGVTGVPYEGTMSFGNSSHEVNRSKHTLIKEFITPPESPSETTNTKWYEYLDEFEITIPTTCKIVPTYGQRLKFVLNNNLIHTFPYFYVDQPVPANTKRESTAKLRIINYMIEMF